MLRSLPDFQWEGVPVLAYKPMDTHFKNVTRQILYAGDPALPVQFRYFEIAPDGYSTLERHQHLHMVVIARGRGQALIGDSIIEVNERDLVTIPTQTWHQFRASRGEILGFYCLVAMERDKPHLPSAEELAKLREDAEIADFIKADHS